MSFQSIARQLAEGADPGAIADAEFHRYNTGRTVTCPGTGAVLDYRQAVTIEPRWADTDEHAGPIYTVSATFYDAKRAELEAAAAAAGVRLIVTDGRTLEDRT